MDTFAPSAFAALPENVAVGISSTILLPMYSGCFGPNAKDDGAPHSDEEMFEGLVDFLGYIWMGEDEGLNRVNAGSGMEQHWFVRLAALLTNLMASSSMIPVRILQTVLAVVQHESNRKSMPSNCGCKFCKAVNTDTCIPCDPNPLLELTTSRCRARQWCVSPVAATASSAAAAPSTDGTCWAKDFSGNFYDQELTQPSAWRCEKACADEGGCEWISRGKCGRCPTHAPPCAEGDVPDSPCAEGEQPVSEGGTCICVEEESVSDISEKCKFATDKVKLFAEEDLPGQKMPLSEQDDGSRCHRPRATSATSPPCDDGLSLLVCTSCNSDDGSQVSVLLLFLRTDTFGSLGICALLNLFFSFFLTFFLFLHFFYHF